MFSPGSKVLKERKFLELVCGPNRKAAESQLSEPDHILECKPACRFSGEDFKGPRCPKAEPTKLVESESPKPARSFDGLQKRCTPYVPSLDKEP
jgi:hypothetical protein